MPTSLTLALAWKRLRKEIKDRGFALPPFELRLIEEGLDGWLATIQQKLTDGFTPAHAEICDVPKGKHLVRPGTLLTTEDAVVYYALIGEMFENIYERVEWARYKIDCSNPMNNEAGDWILHYYRGWENFRTKSVSMLKEYPYVVVTDISAFFENIDHSFLLSDVKSTGVSDEHIKLLRTCLDSWAMTPGKGIPQGYVPSDLLAKLYLDSLDKLLYNSGYKHCRYVDDIRIFCKSYSEAKKAVVFLSSAMRKKGLSLHSGKTEILDAEEAKGKFEDVANIILTIKEGIKQLNMVNLPHDEYSKFEPQVESSDLKKTPIEVVKAAFQKYILEEPAKFNKSVYHFLMGRLVEAKDDFAADHCTYVLSEHPEETDEVLEYLSAIDYRRANSIVASFFCSEQTVYCYQNYLLIRWLNAREKFVPNPNLIGRIRTICFNSENPYYLKAVARKFIGYYGDSSDFERLEELCRAAVGLEQSEIMCCLTQHEKGRRNSFFRKIEGKAYHNKAAIAYVRDVENQLKVKARPK